MAPPSNALIRFATLADVDALVELASLTYRETYGDHLDGGELEDYIAEHFTRTAFSAIMQDASSTLLVSADAARLVGYAHLIMSRPPPCVSGNAPIELCRLYLRRNAIGQGHGAALMMAAHAEARRRGCGTIWLLIYPGNARAREFYSKAGFAEVGTTDFRFGGRIYVDPVFCAPVRPA